MRDESVIRRALEYTRQREAAARADGDRTAEGVCHHHASALAWVLGEDTGPTAIPIPCPNCYRPVYSLNRTTFERQCIGCGCRFTEEVARAKRGDR